MQTVRLQKRSISKFIPFPEGLGWTFGKYIEEYMRKHRQVKVKHKEGPTMAGIHYTWVSIICDCNFWLHTRDIGYTIQTQSGKVYERG